VTDILKTSSNHRVLFDDHGDSSNLRAKLLKAVILKIRVKPKSGS